MTNPAQNVETEAWLEEANRRYADFVRGADIAISAEQVFAELNGGYGDRSESPRNAAS